jgi:hypothetical protein
MKKLILLISAAMALLASDAAKPTSDVVGTNSVKLVAAKPVTGANAWATARYYKQGTVVVNVQRYYMALNDGTSGGTAPVHTSGEVSDGNLMWRFIEQDRQGRNGCLISVNTASTVYWSFSEYEATTNGIKSTGEVCVYIPSEYQGSVHAVCADETPAVIAIQEY